MGSVDLASQYQENHASPVAESDKSRRHNSGNLKSTQSGLSLDFEHGQPLLPAQAKATATLLKAKRATDVTISILALVTLSPLIFIIAILIKATSAGPILFTQNREGLNGKIFRMYKFRTLHWAVSDLSGLNAVTAGDPRVTGIGAFLRRTSFDELPQLFNIILGHMSLVGPRPQVPGMLVGADRYDEVVPYYSLRRKMKPGLTGWAQANGLRGTVESAQSAKARVDHDVAYIANFSLTLDMKILMWTIWQEAVQLGRGT